MSAHAYFIFTDCPNLRDSSNSIVLSIKEIRDALRLKTTHHDSGSAFRRAISDHQPVMMITNVLYRGNYSYWYDWDTFYRHRDVYKLFAIVMSDFTGEVPTDIPWTKIVNHF